MDTLKNFLGNVTFDATANVTKELSLREFVEDILKLDYAEGVIYIYEGFGQIYSMTYSNGMITWQSSERIDRLRGFLIDSIKVNGREKKINYTVLMRDKNSAVIGR